MFYFYWSPYFKQYLKKYRTKEWWMLYFDCKPQYRQQRVQQERRRWFKDLDEDVKLRQKRSPKYLDTSLDLEKQPTCIDFKNWKKLKKRRKQWMNF